MKTFSTKSASLRGTPRITPTASTSVRNGALGPSLRSERTRLQFALGRCSLGAVLVGSSASGICAILLGDDPELLAKELQNRFPQAELFQNHSDAEGLLAQVIRFIEAPHASFEHPLDLRGTAFQQQVWAALRSVPAGQTVSYAELAERTGRPAAVRAVAGACAANPVAVVVPCHRVIRRDGGLSGYRWGIQRKSALLEREGRCLAQTTAPLAA